LTASLFLFKFGEQSAQAKINRISKIENLDNPEFNAKLNLCMWKFGII
jgi:hypothetical protein